MSAAPLPSLFGRFTAILRDHDHLGTTLRELRRMCTALEDGRENEAPQLSPPQLIGQLRQELGEHFAAEERDDYFGTVVAEEPDLTPDIARLKWEHLAMLRAIDTLLDVASEPTRWRELSPPTRQLIAELERHERSESQLLSRLFRSAR
jgi:hypothetical protein